MFLKRKKEAFLKSTELEKKKKKVFPDSSSSANGLENTVELGAWEGVVQRPQPAWVGESMKPLFLKLGPPVPGIWAVEGEPSASEAKVGLLTVE